MGTASVLTLPSLRVWRCKNVACRGWRPSRIILELEYDGRSVMVHRCSSCNTTNRLPDDIDYVRAEARR